MRASSAAKADAAKRLLKDSEMGKGKDIEHANPFASEANLPLMAQDEPRSDVMGGPEYGAPRLTQGLGGMEQQTSEPRYL